MTTSQAPGSSMGEMGQPSSTEIDDGLADYLEAGEKVTHRLSGSKGLVVDHPHEPQSDGGQEVGTELKAVVTDHRVLLVTDEDAFDIRHTDVRDVTYEDRLLRKSTVILSDWDGAQYRFTPTNGDVKSAVSQIEGLVDSWQFVGALLDELGGRVASMQMEIQDGAYDTIQNDLTKAEETYEELVQYVESEGFRETFARHLDEAQADLQRVRVRALLVRASELFETGDSLQDDGDWHDAFGRYNRAKNHIETAESLAEAHDLDTSKIETGKARVSDCLESLAPDAIETAESAIDTAIKSDDPAEIWASYETAFRAYRNVLEMGWGRDIERPYTVDQLRYCVALSVRGLVETSHDSAAAKEAVGEAYAQQGETDEARNVYLDALACLDRAKTLCNEYRITEPTELDGKRQDIEAKMSTLDAWAWGNDD